MSTNLEKFLDLKNKNSLLWKNHDNEMFNKKLNKIKKRLTNYDNSIMAINLNDLDFVILKKKRNKIRKKLKDIKFDKNVLLMEIKHNKVSINSNKEMIKNNDKNILVGLNQLNITSENLLFKKGKNSKVKKYYKGKEEMNYCDICGEVSRKEVCSACRIIGLLK